MNEIKLTGRLLNIYQDSKSENLVAKIAVMHDHKIGYETIRVESVFTAIMSDFSKISTIDAKAGDNVMLTGYLKVDFKQTLGGNEHKKVMIYFTNLEVLPNRNPLYSSL